MLIPRYSPIEEDLRQGHLKMNKAGGEEVFINRRVLSDLEKGVCQIVPLLIGS